MTFMKLKQNISYAILSILFQICTPETCRVRILDMIDTLYKCLKPAIYWTTKENVSRNIPQYFERFSNNTKIKKIMLSIEHLLLL